MPAQEKLVSIFKPHTTQVIPRGKSGKPTEFGRKVGLCEVEGGIISDYRILEEGDPKDEKAKSYLAFRDVPAAVRALVEAFGRGPRDAFGRQRSDARARGKTSSLAKAGA